MTCERGLQPHAKNDEVRLRALLEEFEPHKYVIERRSLAAAQVQLLLAIIARHRHVLRNSYSREV
jgi:hypothetical protein